MKSGLLCITVCFVLGCLYCVSIVKSSVPNHLHNDNGRIRMTSIQLVCGDINEIKLMSAGLHAHTHTHTDRNFRALANNIRKQLNFMPNKVRLILIQQAFLIKCKIIHSLMFGSLFCCSVVSTFGSHKFGKSRTHNPNIIILEKNNGMEWKERSGCVMRRKKKKMERQQQIKITQVALDRMEERIEP